ncbi:NAD(P)-dependent oxidoreductase [Jiella pelagia]|uniref:NAD(P)-dependent oxidoreductase n=1 Tax=Jiella pelagia TaxID=2986949 RepID=A0ABY7BTE4_9HYPH|nr:NAD(P)-dependent oxidoreductase [Jiella pelagia]WAP66929.1 NAD(P)-dependent oxidoreductase [Jiella pelagia]
MSKQTIGIVGVGMMGHGIARNVLKAGFPLGYLAHPGNQSTADLDEAGARRFDAVQDLVAASDVVILVVTGSAQIEELILSDDSLVGSLRAGTIVVDCSTGIPAVTIKAAERVAAARGRFVDAAMTRTPKEAEEGRLNLLIGGEEATVAELTPLFETFSENRFHAGPVGSGQMLKLIHNFVSLGTVTLISEAAACAAENGIAAEILVDCLRRGGGHGAALERVAPFLLEGETSQMRFTNANALKDLSYYGKLVEATGTRRDVAEGVLSALGWLNENGFGEEMAPEAARAFRKRG